MADHSASDVSSPRLPIGIEDLRSASIAVAAGLVGFAIVLWVAANWVEWGRLTRFALVGGVFTLAALMAALSPRIRAPAALIAFFAIGALFAAIGQAYQSVADPWPLFAIWALVALPLAVAARSDVLWSLWIVVVHTALALWLRDVGNGELANVLLAWIFISAIAALMHPALELHAVMGRTRWAGRIAIALAAALVAATTIGTGWSATALFGLLLLAGAIAFLVTARPLDLPVLTLVTIAFDVTLLTALLWNMQVFRPLEYLFFAGIVSMIVFAGSGAALMEIARTSGTTARLSAGQWPILVLSGIGALVATVPLIAFIALFIGAPLVKFAPTTYLIGGGLVVGAGWQIAKAKSVGFGVFVAIIFTACGLGLLMYGLYRDLPFIVANATLAVGATVAAFNVRLRWAITLLGAVAAVFAGLFFSEAAMRLIDSGTSSKLWALRGSMTWGILAAAALAWFMLTMLSHRFPRAPLDDIRDRFQGFAAGWSGMTLTGALFAVGPTFLIGGTGRGAEFFNQALSLGLAVTPLRVAAVFIIAASLGALVGQTGRRDPMSLGAVIAAVLLGYLIPALAAPIAIWAAAVATGQRVLAIAAVGAAIWLIGAFYYWLGLPLVVKAYILAGLGAGLGAIAWLSGGRTGNAGRDTASALVNLFSFGLFPAGLVVASWTATIALATNTISANEEVIANGRRVFIELAPRDPRSRVQGDYMALNFTAPRETQRAKHSRPDYAIATIDIRDVATVERYADAPSRERGNEIAFRVGWQRNRPIIGTNAFYFEEGTAKDYREARFGEFRLGPEGEIILIALTDADRNRLGRALP